MTELGIIEGYFGRAWTWKERADVVSLLAPAGYRFFHYAPKIDALLRRNWRQLYDEQGLADIAVFASHCHALGMRFGVGLTPFGVQHAFGDDERAALKAKLVQLNTLQLNDLAILFDDMDGDIADLAERQAGVVQFIAEHSAAERFFLCPSYYSDDPVLDRVF
ncbi:MAG: protein O-GlcNAcase, partial [Sphingopyxis sp.]|nr:protein O-GlcNAcase [Sphingopyxis sp.]